MTLDDIKNINLVEFLSRNYGLQFESRGGKQFCSSPFSPNDKTPSLCVYTDTNSFYDFSSAFGGSILDFVKRKEGVTLIKAISLIKQNDIESFSKVEQTAETTEKPKIVFKLRDHLTHDRSEKAQIRRYALSRKIKYHYVCAFFYERLGVEFKRRLAMGFVLYDDLGNPVGIKLRNIDSTGDRFRVKGSLGVYRLDYILEDSFEDPTLYIIEGESNANSLWEFLKLSNKNSVVLCYGAVSTPPKQLPLDLQHIKNKKLILDRDHDKITKEKYEERLEFYKHLKCQPVTLNLDKGEDINQLFIFNKFNILNTLL